MAKLSTPPEAPLPSQTETLTPEQWAEKLRTRRSIFVAANARLQWTGKQLTQAEYEAGIAKLSNVSLGYSLPGGAKKE